jgi:molybdopterin molybdotransferase
MITFKNALNIILNNVKIIGIDNISIINSVGRIAAEDIYSSIDLPSFDISRMDGYAVKYSDTDNASINNPKILKIVEELSAGNIPSKRLKVGETIRVMTGVKLPHGCEAVVKLEDTLRERDKVKILKSVRLNENIKSSGSDIKSGDIIVSKGEKIKPENISLLASIGSSYIKVYKIPRISIISTGDELIEINNKIENGKLINSNSYMLGAQSIECGAIPIIAGITKDKRGNFRKILMTSLSNSDIIISTGGTGKGDYDIIRDELKSIGVDIIFSDVAIRPGSSIIFSLINDKPFFGLPGSPGAAMITFEEFVRPSILKITGCNKIFRPTIDAIIKEDLKSNNGIRNFITASLKWDMNNYSVNPTKRGFNAIIVVPEDRAYIKAKESIKVQILYGDEI